MSGAASRPFKRCSGSRRRSACGGEDARRSSAGCGRRVPFVELERAAEEDAVGAREHVAGTAGERRSGPPAAARGSRAGRATGCSSWSPNRSRLPSPVQLNTRRFGQRGDIGRASRTRGPRSCRRRSARRASSGGGSGRSRRTSCRSGARCRAGTDARPGDSMRLIGGKVGDELRFRAVASRHRSAASGSP